VVRYDFLTRLYSVAGLQDDVPVVHGKRVVGLPGDFQQGHGLPRVRIGMHECIHAYRHAVLHIGMHAFLRAVSGFSVSPGWHVYGHPVTCEQNVCLRMHLHSRVVTPTPRTSAFCLNMALPRLLLLSGVCCGRLCLCIRCSRYRRSYLCFGLLLSLSSSYVGATH